MVAKPALTISPTKMNVFYIGVDNPVSISVPGSPERVVPTPSVGKIRYESANDWIIYDLPKNARTCDISVNAIFSGGKPRNMGATTFRLRTVPNPDASIGGMIDGNISKGLIQVSPYVIAKMPEWFEFDIKYMVTSYRLNLQVQGDWFPYQINGNRIPPQHLQDILGMKPNSKLIIDNIKVVGPDERELKSLVLTIQN
jgi:hypothetical protein